ncbi:MAG: propanediol dehydratase small subunit PduE [Hyphomicrobiales bacterium]|nr:propanediol dehydratase small subunit PduE [Hyphomicrobiales bacterium]
MSDKPPAREFRFPLGKHHRDKISTQSGRPLSDLTLDQVLSDNVLPDDVSVNAETLKVQAQFAREAGYEQVAQNLARAAEMTGIPNDELLEIYESLRPGRSTYYQLLSISQRIASMYGAELTGAYIREAADVYRDTGLLKMAEE